VLRCVLLVVPLRTARDFAGLCSCIGASDGVVALGAAADGARGAGGGRARDARPAGGRGE